tara:strand:+ start:2106 stop:2516 length:411 start_codon:yes stop_codon:yes gene_type:complete
MAVREQLIVSWQNRSGELANVCRVLSDVGINIEALATAEAGEYGAVRLVVDDVGMARKIFHKAQVAHTAIDVLVVLLPNRAGFLADIAGRLSEEKINIEYFYSSVAPGVERALGVFKVSDPRRADEIINTMMEAND